MEWICIMGSVLLTGLVLLKRNYKKEFVRQHRKEFGWIYPIAPCMLWLSHWWSKRNREKEKKNMPGQFSWGGSKIIKGRFIWSGDLGELFIV